jgi:hypothetical protein
MRRLVKYIGILIFTFMLISCGGGSDSTGPSESISIDSPNGGESWQIGTTHTISWSTNIDENVKIELLKSNSVVKTIVDSTSGSYSWQISENITPASDYKIKISSVDNSGIYDTSDSTFTIEGVSASTLIEEGWIAFDSGNYEESLSSFQEAVNKDSSMKEGYIGVAVSYLESSSHTETEAETVLESNVISSASGDDLTAAQAILLGIKMKDISNTSYIYDGLYTNGLDGLSSSWNYFINLNIDYGTNISLDYLKGYMINLCLGEVLIRENSYLSDARTAVDKVLNYSNFSSLPADVQNRANELDSQLENAGY